MDDDDQKTLIESDQHGGGWRRTCTSNDDASDDTSDDNRDADSEADDAPQVHNNMTCFLCLSPYVQMSSPCHQNQATSEEISGDGSTFTATTARTAFSEASPVQVTFYVSVTLDIHCHVPFAGTTEKGNHRQDV